MTLRPRHGLLSAVALAGAWLVLASPGHAALGGALESLQADRSHLSASLKSQTTGAQTVHTLTLANGTIVREYARPDGVIFAVAWQGPSRPDLRQLLGPSFPTFQADSVARGGRRTRAMLVSNRSTLIVRSGGRPGGFRGFAELPKLAPAGFSATQLP